MTKATNRRLWSIDQRWLVSDVIVVSIAIDANKVVDTLSNAKSRLANSTAVAHIHKLIQRLVGIFIDPLWSWLEHEE